MTTPLIMNAAGLYSKSLEDVERLCRAYGTTHVVSGSWTVNPRGGNGKITEAFYVALDGTSVNSMGLPNAGLPYLREYLPAMLAACAKHGKKLVVSISAADHNDEFANLCSFLKGFPEVIVELNFACPNIWKGDGVNKGVLFFDLKTVTDVLRTVGPYVREGWVKVAPCTDAGYMREAASVLVRYGVNKVVAVNTLPGTKLLVAGHPALKVTNGLGGMAGTGLHALALHNAAFYASILSEGVVIGVGGIDCYTRLQNFLRRGVGGVQIGTRFFVDVNIETFRQIQSAELADDKLSL